jgi:hypothetical protein
MGYRSTVAYTIRFIPKHSPDTDDIEEERKARASFYTFLAEAKSKEDTALCFVEEELKYLEIDEKKLEFRFFVEYVKWYDSYPEVMCHEALIQLSRDWYDEGDVECIGGAFARVGEEMDDNTYEVWGAGDYDWVGINRSVYCDWMG